MNYIYIIKIFIYNKILFGLEYPKNKKKKEEKKGKRGNEETKNEKRKICSHRF